MLVKVSDVLTINTDFIESIIKKHDAILVTMNSGKEYFLNATELGTLLLDCPNINDQPWWR